MKTILLATFVCLIASCPLIAQEPNLDADPSTFKETSFRQFATGFADLGYGDPDTGLLEGTGTCVPASTFSLDLTESLPNVTAGVIVGWSSDPTEIYGGVLVPTPDFAITVATNSLGEFSLTSNWPDLAFGTPLYFQMVFVDPGASYGYSFSNAIVGITDQDPERVPVERKLGEDEYPLIRGEWFTLLQSDGAECTEWQFENTSTDPNSRIEILGRWELDGDPSNYEKSPQQSALVRQQHSNVIS